jgi:hypothetical protein
MIFLSVYELREANNLNCHFNKHGKMLHGHNAHSLNTIIKTEPGILQIMKVFLLMPQRVLTTTVMVMGLYFVTQLHCFLLRTEAL